jgi:hypothetical protein
MHEPLVSLQTIASQPPEEKLAFVPLIAETALLLFAPVVLEAAVPVGTARRAGRGMKGTRPVYPPLAKTLLANAHNGDTARKTVPEAD